MRPSPVKTGPGTSLPVNILVVDDVPAKLLAMEALLSELRENVVCVHSGADALRQLLEREFAVILLDVNMPDMDGFETAELIRQHPRLRRVPIIFMTAASDDTHALRGYSLGAVDYVLTPVVPDVLRTKVRVFVELFRMAAELRQQAEERVTLAREQAGRAAAEEAARRSALLADAGKHIARSLNLEATAKTVLDLLVPDLADSATLRLRRHGSDTVYARHRHRADAAGEASPPATRDAPAGVEATAAPSPAVLQAMDAAAATLGRQPIVDRAGGAESVRGVACPLFARGALLGVLAVVHAPAGGRVYDAASVALIEEMAGRAAIALDNCLLYREIEERDIRKEQFVAMLAHELRNPLGAITSAVAVMEMVGGDAGDRAREIIKRQLHGLAQLVEDLVDTTRITTGKIRLTRSPINLAESVTRCLRTIEIAGRTQGHHVAVDAQEAWIHADSARIDQVLANLIGNALKYTPAGGHITVRVRAVDDRAVCEVTDTGLGMSPEVLQRAFELFYQEERSSDRGRGGLGIGLTLVRQLVELHGGTVDATSDGEGRGSRFTIRLPLSVPGGPTETGPAAAPADSARWRILLVEDNGDARQMLQMLLILAGHEVDSAANGVTGLEQAIRNRPDVVVIDLGLPELDGYEVARRLRAEGAAVGLVALTGYGQPGDREKALAAGFDAHVVKPVDPAHLTDVIASVLLRRREPPRSETAGAGDLPVKDGRPLLGEGA
ncbi:MAG TPA: response regulator [Methylomirabilota bacterium]|jgi:signal transduction histidine kinase/DNA-binding response OmpR family regulator|nr:response regulator [Methylomirabilota bacterium]